MFDIRNEFVCLYIYSFVGGKRSDSRNDYTNHGAGLERPVHANIVAVARNNYDLTLFHSIELGYVSRRVSSSGTF